MNYNGYTMLADNYRKACEQGEITQEVRDKECKILDFLGTCNDEDLYRMIDTSAFNEVIITFCKKAIRNAGVDENDESNIMHELRCLFDEKTCSEVMNFCK